MSYIITRRPPIHDPFVTQPIEEQVYCIHDLQEMGGRMFGKARWCSWKDSGLPNQVIVYRTAQEAGARLFQLKHKDPDWDYKVEFYDR